MVPGVFSLFWEGMSKNTSLDSSERGKGNDWDGKILSPRG